MSESSINFRPEPEWQWYSCVFDLKKVLKNKEVFSSLAPSIVLNHPNFTEDNVFIYNFMFLILLIFKACRS